MEKIIPATATMHDNHAWPVTQRVSVSISTKSLLKKYLSPTLERLNIPSHNQALWIITGQRSWTVNSLPGQAERKTIFIKTSPFWFLIHFQIKPLGLFILFYSIHEQKFLLNTLFGEGLCLSAFDELWPICNFRGATNTWNSLSLMQQ